MLRKLLSFLSERVLKASQHSIPCAVARCARLSREPAEQYLFGNMLVAWVHESFEPVFLGVMPLLQIRMWPFQVITDWKSHEFPSTSPQKISHNCPPKRWVNCVFEVETFLYFMGQKWLRQENPLPESSKSLLFIWAPKKPTNKKPDCLKAESLDTLAFTEGVTMYQTQSRWWFQIFFLIFTSKLGKWSNLTNIFQMGWFNHQPAIHAKFPRLRRCTSSGPPKSLALRVCYHPSSRICRSKTHQNRWYTYRGYIITQ